MFELRPTPVDLSRSAVRSLPRWALLALLAAFIVPGFWGHSIWTNDMGQAFGEMWSMEQNVPGAWLLPQAAGQVAVQHGPLPSWLGLLFMHLLGGVFVPTTAARVAGIAWFSLASVCVWYGTWFLARRQEAQPVHQAFGPSPTSRDFGRLVADAATLFFVSYFGILIRLHDPSAENASIALCALAFLGCAWSLQKPWKGVLTSAIACAGLGLTVGLQVALAALVAASLAQIGFAFTSKRKAVVLLIGLWAISIVLFIWWPLLAQQKYPELAPAWFDAWCKYQLGAADFDSSTAWLWFLEKCVWYLFPVWPFACYALWSWRKNWKSPFVLLPLVGLFSWLVFFIASPANRATDLLAVILVPLSSLAAFGLMSCRNSTRSFLAFFSVGVYSIALLCLWAYWGAWATGFPPKMAHSIVRLAPDSEALSTGVLGIAIVVVMSFIWFYFAYQRIVHRPEVRWTGPWLAALGMTAVWMAAFFLFRPSFEMARSYAPLAQELRVQVQTWNMDPEAVCVNPSNVPSNIGAQISYYSALRFSLEDSCFLTLQRDRIQKDEDFPEVSFKRPHTDEVFVLTKK